MSTWKSYTGGKLSNGAHAAYHQELVSLMEESTAATLHIDTLFPAYKEAVALELALIKKIAGSRHTVTVEDANARCDSWLRAFFAVRKGFGQAPKGSEERGHADALLAIANSYSSIMKHELSKQITETRGLLAALEEAKAGEAVEAMGLTHLVSQLEQDTDALEEAIRQRNREDAAFAKQYGTLTATAQRKEVDELYQQIVTRVNAYNVVEPSEDIEAFILDATATANHFANVAAQGGTSKPNLDPGPRTSTGSDEEEEEEEERPGGL